MWTVFADESTPLILQDSLTGDVDVSKLPLHPSPPGLESGELLVDLLPHQSQALQVGLIDATAVWIC
jgi:SWI/SNF-related matrix-associated actin-dependent regulator of chromatin subfamily A3